MTLPSAMMMRKAFSRVLTRKLTRRKRYSLFIACIFLAGLLCDHLISRYVRLDGSASMNDARNSNRNIASFPSAPDVSYSRRVANAMEVSFDAYWDYCKGHDEYDPVTSACIDWLGIGVTAIDSLDTLLIMGLTRQYKAVLEHESKYTTLQYMNKAPKYTNVFEFGIRALGGLNSAYQLSGDAIWLKRAVEVADLILPAFTNTKSNCPLGETVLGTRQTRHFKYLGNFVAGTADTGSLQLEMRTLSRLSGDRKYAIAGDRCAESMLAAIPSNRVVSPTFNTDQGKFLDGAQIIGGGVDSYIEMLLKIWVASNKSISDARFKNAFVQQADLVLSKLTREENGTVVLGDRGHWNKMPEASMEHLSCFFPGVLALASMYGVGDKEKDRHYLHWAERLAYTCFLFSRSNSEGLAPETAYITPGGQIEVGTTTCILRPEIVESLFVLYQVTGDEKYRAMGRSMWDSIETSAMLPNGRLAPVIHLGESGSLHSGKLHSFVLAETLKYFFLLFREKGDQGRNIDLGKMVFNTEAHPVHII